MSTTTCETSDDTRNDKGDDAPDRRPVDTDVSDRHPAWLKSAVFYEIYPQSFFDSNADGIGDLLGIVEKLDYIQDLGCNALWINPCFDSPFKDAGYDVRDYRRVAPRYGSNEDLIELFAQAHRRGIHVLLDLVPGHTSEEHEWFVRSKEAERNACSDRYIWTDSAFHGYSMPFVGGESERDATYILNFFKCQPALNYGFAKRDEPWQSAPDSKAALDTQAAMVEIMRFWLSAGCDGFRVDMANSLVKNDGDDKPETIRAWRRMLGAIKHEYPQSAFVSEWGVPKQALAAGFDMDFYLDWRWNGTGNGYNLLARNVDDTLDARHDHSYFSAVGGGSICAFLDQYLPQYEESKDHGEFCFITCNHDTPRLAPRLDARERAIAFGMFLTMPGVPFLYYGDEIGMRYRSLPTKEGGYARTGSRTPMQWDHGENLGFSKASPSALYLPVDDADDAPTVAGEQGDDHSTLAWVRRLLALRAAHEDLRASCAFDVVAAPKNGRIFAFRRRAARGEGLLVVMNPGTHAERVDRAETMTETMTETTAAQDEDPAHGVAHEPLISLGSVAWSQEELTMGPQSFAVFALR